MKQRVIYPIDPRPMNSNMMDGAMIDNSMESSEPVVFTRAPHLHPAKNTTPLSLVISDPIYAPVIDALTQLHEHAKAKNKLKIKKIRHEAAIQIDHLCSQLSQAREALCGNEQKLHVQETINKNYHAEIALLQEQLKEDTEKLNKKNSELIIENETLSRELALLHQQQRVWQLSAEPLEAEIQVLSRHNKEKTAQLIQAEQTIEELHTALSISRREVTELENKNQKMQNELFEHWMHNKDRL